NQEHTSSGHFGDQDTPTVEEDSGVAQQPERFIATDKPRRTTKAPSRLIEEVNLIAYALNVAEDIEEGITPSEDVRFKARLVAYVDDMLIAAKDKAQIEKLKGQLNNEFDMKDLGAAKRIIEMEIIRERQFGKLYLSQQGAVGSLMYAMVALSVVSRYMADPGKKHGKAVQWIFRYLHGTSNVCLEFEKSKYGLVGYVDSDYADDLDKRRSLIVEYMAISEACKEAIWLRNLFNELSGFTSCTTIFCDSQSAIYLTKDQMFHERTKHIDVRYHFIRGIIAQGDVKI
ncbi:retrotransposon protein, putative, ty1-copia subclass, partial [Tanacetum coccineum]